LVTDHAGLPVGWGFYNPVSMFAVRLVQTCAEAAARPAAALDPAALIAWRVGQAAAARAALGLPGPGTDVYRLINSEGDRLSGVTADALGPGCVVVSSCAAWSERCGAAPAVLLFLLFSPPPHAAAAALPRSASAVIRPRAC